MSLSCSFLRGQRVLPSWMGGGGRLFLFNPLCSEGNAVGRFNKSSRYCFHITGCKLTEHVNGQTNGSVIRGSVRHDLLLSGNKKKKEVTAFILLFGNTQTEIGEINALFHLSSLFNSKKNTWSELFESILPPFTTSSCNPGSQSEVKLFRSPAALRPNVSGSAGAVCLCFVSLLLRHSCAQRPGTFHSLSEL